MKKMNKKGFTLAELLIVVAIIAVLVAIAIPVFSSQLEKSKEAADEANIRAYYATVVADMLTNNTAYPTNYNGAKLNYQTEKLTWSVDAAGKLTVAYNANKVDDLSLEALPME